MSSCAGKEGRDMLVRTAMSAALSASRCAASCAMRARAAAVSTTNARGTSPPAVGCKSDKCTPCGAARVSWGGR